MNPADLVAAFERSSARWIDQPAFFDGTTSVSYGELARQTRELRRAFIDLGVGPGDRVAMLANLRIEWVVTALATYGLGAELVVLDAAAPADLTTTKVFIFDAAVVLAAATFPEPAADTHVIDLDGLDASSYRGLITRGRRDPAPASAEPGPSSAVVSPSAAVPSTMKLDRSIPLSLGDRVVTSVHTTDAERRVWLPLLSGATLAPTDDLLATSARVRPTVIIATPTEATSLADAMFAAIAPHYRPLFGLKLAAARRRRALHASGRRSTLLNLGHVLIDRIAGHHARAIFGHHLRLVVSTGPMPALTRERLELVGLATFVSSEGDAAQPIV